MLIGAMGKMAKEIKKLSPNFNVNIMLEVDKNFNTKKENCFKNLKTIKSDLIKNIDAVLDFSSPQVLSELIEFCVKFNLPLIICTTGHKDKDKKLYKLASKSIPIFYSSNTSFGIYLISKFLKTNQKLLKDFDVNIIEVHHKEKLDMPSGTAKSFEEILSSSSPTIHSIRAGNIVGEHKIIFTSPYEQIEISHTAFDRKLFAEGALKICKYFLKKVPPKLYTMDDIFNV